MASLWVWDAAEILDCPSFPAATIWQTCNVLRLAINALPLPALCSAAAVTTVRNLRAVQSTQSQVTALALLQVCL